MCVDIPKVKDAVRKRVRGEPGDEVPHTAPKAKGRGKGRGRKAKVLQPTQEAAAPSEQPAKGDEAADAAEAPGAPASADSPKKQSPNKRPTKSRKQATEADKEDAAKSVKTAWAKKDFYFVVTERVQL